MRLKAKVPRKSEHHAGLRLAAVAGIVADDKSDIGGETQRFDMPLRARFGIIGRDAQLQAEPLERREHFGRPADRHQRFQRFHRAQMIDLQLERGVIGAAERVAPICP